MKQILHIALLVGMLIFSNRTDAQNNEIRRICLNTNDTSITLSWNGYTNSCGTFIRGEVWGRKQSDPFSLWHTTSTNVAKELEFKVGSLDQTWSFYILIIAPCVGDSFYSDTISIDISKPPMSEIDSVSIEQSTQHIILGWTPNAASDTKGYRIYRYGGAINDSIGDTSATFYKTLTFNNLDGPELSIAAYDSCNLYAPISSPHRPVVLRFTNTSDCNKNASLSWTSYLGWGGSVEYTLFKALNNNPYQPVFQGNLLQYLDTGIQYGDSVCYFVRSTNTINGFTSSSNRTCYKRWSPEPDNAFAILNFSSNLESTFVVFDVSASEAGSIDSIQYVIRSPQNTSTGNKRANEYDERVAGFNYYHIETPLDPADLHLLSVEAYDKCGLPLQSKETAQNTVLQINEQTLQWNPFSLWANPLLTEQFIVFSESGSTWNNLTEVGINEAIYEIEDIEIIDRTCFRVVKTVTDQSSSAVHDASPIPLINYSNIQCLAGKLTFFIPTGISLGGSNNMFYVFGNGIDREASNLIVFNRWGEQVVRQSLTEPWFPANQRLLPGAYFYQATIRGFNGEKQNSSGPIYIIE